VSETTTTAPVADPWELTPSRGGGGGGTEKPPPGNHLAALVAVIDLGTQDTGFGGEVKFQRRAYFVWELVGVEMAGTKGRNHVIGLDLTVSLNEKAKLRKFIEARKGSPIKDGEPYRVTDELGKHCMCNVVMKGDYPKVDGIAAPPAIQGMTLPAPKHPPFAWNLKGHRKGDPIEIPDWVPFLYGCPIPDVIQASKELGGTGKAVRPGKDGAAESADPIPF
jgi:hypothetical protein